MKTPKNAKFETLAIHAGQIPDPSTGAIMTPIYQTATYVQEKIGKHKGFEYSRTGNPTRSAYEACVAALECGGEDKGYGIAFSSGCGASATIQHMLKPGDHVVASDDLYGGTFRLFDKVFKAEGKGIEYTFTDLSNLANLEKAWKPNTKMLWLETPTNPMLKLIDIQAATSFARARGALTVVDNTFMSPYRQRPIELGADMVLHSATNRKDLADRLYFLQNAIGAVPGPMDSWLALRGLKTLHLRMDRTETNAIAIANFLVKHPAVEKVIYPGLVSHPGHELAKRQMKGFGGMISFVAKGGMEKARRVVEGTKIFALAESLGGVESLIEHPALMTHASVPEENRAKLGISDGLVRLSVGVEHVDDLMDDLRAALGE
jgi:cystathionine gamma-lyase